MQKEMICIGQSLLLMTMLIMILSGREHYQKLQLVPGSFLLIHKMALGERFV